jgi:hypothetical protein
MKVIDLGQYKRYGRNKANTVGKRKRKIKVKVDKWDHWNAEHTLALIILPVLKQLKAKLHGAGYTEDEDVPEELRSTVCKPKENLWDTDDNHFLRWDWILDQMIWSFDLLVNEDDVATFKLSIEEMRVRDDKINNGLRLFGKYYRGLWD